MKTRPRGRRMLIGKDRNFSVPRASIVRVTDDIARALTAVLAAAPARAAARPTIGIGGQKARMFADPRWQCLGLGEVRYIAPWDALSDPRQLELLDVWMAASGPAARARCSQSPGAAGGRGARTTRSCASWPRMRR